MCKRIGVMVIVLSHIVWTLVFFRGVMGQKTK
jgi:hypothetical protein